jgi:hypothetical protein
MKSVNGIHWDEPGRIESLLPRIEPNVARVLSKALKGGELDFDEGLTLARTVTS